MKTTIHKIYFSLLLLFLIGIGTSYGQSYTDSETGFDAARLTQSLIERGISQEDIDQEITIERALYVEMYKQMQAEFKTSEKSIVQKNVTAKTAVVCIAVPASERQALIALYTATNGPGWINSTNWNTTADVCDWYGVTVTNGNVTEINLNNNNLAGNIPPEIGNLLGLKALKLFGNQLSGSLPMEIGNLSLLESLFLSINQLSGEIPTTFGNLSNLQSLSLYSNQLTGAIPLVLSNLSLLQSLNIASNHFTGTIPVALGNLFSLQSLILNSNQLTGNIPPVLGNLSSLQMLSLSINQLSGSIPQELGNLTALLKLYIGGNLLTGTIPSELGNLPLLQTLYLNSNQLTGNIPSSLGNLSLLQLLSLSNNRLYGAIPNELGNLASLQTLNLSLNQLTGNIPQGLKTLDTLQSFWVYNNRLSGTIPNFTSLINYFNFSNNNYVFRDFETEHVAYLNNLAEGYSNSPQAKVDQTKTVNVVEGFSYTLTTSLSNPNNNYQWFKDGVPIGEITKNKDYVIDIATLDSAGTYHVVITNDIVTDLILQRNPIILNVEINPCSVPEIEKQALVALYNLTDGPNWLNSWSMEQDIPVCEWFGVTVTDGHVSKLELMDNGLIGTIPNELGNLTNLITLNLSNNQLSGTIPNTLNTITTLSTFIFDGNMFVFNNFENEHVTYTSNFLIYNYSPQAKVDQEEDRNVLLGTSQTFTTSLSSTNNSYQWYKDGVAILDATSREYIINEVTANDTGVYYMIATNSIVTSLTLERHPINLSVVDTICSVPTIERNALIDLYNALNGINWTNNTNWNSDAQLCDWFGITITNGHVSHVNLSSNQLIGEIPSSLGDLTNLISLDLSSNQIYGSIPIELGNLSLLQQVYVGNNQLSGGIPSSLGNLTNLISLSLGGNQLSGNIPNLTITSLFDFQNNAFIFSNFENDHTTYLNNIPNYLFSPQAKVDIAESVTVVASSNYTLTTSLSSVNNSYQWFKDGLEIAGATVKDYVINSISVNDAGSYHVLVTNSIVTGLTIERYPITLVVTEDTCGVATSERQALIDFYIATNGSGWTNNTNWNTNAPVCDWFGVTVTNGTVTRLDLENNNMIGVIPSSIGDILNIGNLIINNNQLSGEIPSSLGSLGSLSEFNFQNNAFVFRDFEAGHVTYLSTINLYTYSPQVKVDLEETITIVATSNYTLTTSLSSVNNSYQWFKDGVEIPGATAKDYLINSATANDTGIYYVSATNSIVTGLTIERQPITLVVTAGTCEVPVDERNALIALYSATNGSNWINNTNWNTTAPVCVWHGVTVINGTITSIELNSNNLSGDIPIELGALSNLQTLSLNNNQLTGNIPRELGNLNSLHSLQLSSNQLTGNIPLELGNLSLLQLLSLESNQLVGNIPLELGNLTMLHKIILYSNQLTGSIPPELGNLSLLQSLDIASNQISGTIPSTLGNLSLLETLILSNNKLTGNIPSALGNLSSLQVLSIDRNNLYGGIPTEFGNLSSLQTLNISLNRLTGTIPQSMGNLSNLKSFWLNNNQLSGTIPNLMALNYSFNFSNNAFIFGDFDSEHNAYLNNLTESYSYSPQAKIDQVETIVAVEGFSYTLSISLNNPNNNYQWYKDDQPIGGISKNKDFVINSAASGDAGVYYVLVTNDIVTNLTLERNHITVIFAINFCTSELDQYPTINDLIPNGTSVNWYFNETGGGQLNKSDEIIELAEDDEGAVYWWDDTNDTISTRTSVKVYINQGTPQGEDYQIFSIGQNATVSDLQMEGTNISWFDSGTSVTPLSGATLLVNEGIYFADDVGTSTCRLAVDVFVGTLPPEGNGVQFMCPEQTIGDLVVDLQAGATVVWYLSDTLGTQQPLTTVLTHNTKYYAAQIDADNYESIQRKEVTVYLNNVQVPIITFSTQTFYSDEPHTIANLSAIGYVKWYDQSTGGIVYGVAETLIDGQTYYAEQKIGSCASGRIPVLVQVLLEASPSTLLGCEKFKPQIGGRYVLSGWVKEQEFLPVNPVINQFNNSEISVLFVDLLNHLKDRLLSADPLFNQIPAAYIPESDTENLNFDPLIPYITNITSDELKLTIYDFTRIKDAYGRTVGFSFALNKNKTHTFTYLSPFVQISGEPNPKDYRYPILNNSANLILEFKDVSVQGGLFYINSDFSISNGTSSMSLVGDNRSESGASGIESSVDFYDYNELTDYQPMSFTNAFIKLEYLDSNRDFLISETITFRPQGEVIDGWQRISGDFTIPGSAVQMSINLQNEGMNINAYFDDLRIHPFDSNMKTFVYHPVTQRLMSELDENNYSTYYEYDSEGGLIRVKKETVKGVYTIQETRSGTIKVNN